MAPFSRSYDAPAGRLFSDLPLWAVPAGRVVPVLDVADAVPGAEVEVPVRADPVSAHGFASPSQQRTTTRWRPTLRVPFHGCAELFRVRPEGIVIDPQIDPPVAEIEDDELVLTYRGPSDDHGEQHRALDAQVAIVEQMLGYLRIARGQ